MDVVSVVVVSFAVVVTFDTCCCCCSCSNRILSYNGLSGNIVISCVKYSRVLNSWTTASSNSRAVSISIVGTLDNDTASGTIGISTLSSMSLTLLPPLVLGGTSVTSTSSEFGFNVLIGRNTSTASILLPIRLVIVVIELFVFSLVVVANMASSLFCI